MSFDPEVHDRMRELAAAVLVRALNDARPRYVGNDRHAKKRREQRADAIRWARSTSSGIELWCRLADVPVDRFRVAIKEAASGKKITCIRC